MITMNIKEYFDIDLRITLLSAIIAAITGYVSFIINEPLQSLGIAVVIVAVLAFFLKKIFKIEKERKWWISNCIIIFMFTWLIVWTIFYNLRLA